MNAAIQEHKRAVAEAEVRYARTEELVRNARIGQAQLLEERSKLQSAKAALERAQTELKLLTGGGKEQGIRSLHGADDQRAIESALRYLLSARPGKESQQATAVAVLAGLEAYRNTRAIKGPIPDRIRAALDKPVKLGGAEESVSIEKALEVFKKLAGLDVAVVQRYQIVPIQTKGEELSVGAWFQMFADNNPDSTICVREYGMLITLRKESPPDAQTLAEFWKQKPEPKKQLPAPDLKELENMLAFLKNRRTELSSKYGPGHPEMVQLNRQITALEKELKERGDQPKK